eukprot:11166908-Lingulodinium_polyedra.AAC.1
MAGSVKRPGPARYLATPKLSPEHSTEPGGQTSCWRASVDIRAAQASATRAGTPTGIARARTRAHPSGPRAQTMAMLTAK